MRSPRLGNLILIAGAVVGVAAVMGLVVGFEPAKLPPALLNIAAYKLTFVAAAGLLAAGAAIRRRERRDSDDREGRAEGSALGDTSVRPPGLPASRPEPDFSPPRNAEGVRNDRR